MSTQPPDQELDIYLSTPRTDNITYIQGSLMDNMTCRRAGVEYAKVKPTPMPSAGGRVWIRLGCNSVLGVAGVC